MLSRSDVLETVKTYQFVEPGVEGTGLIISVPFKMFGKLPATNGTVYAWEGVYTFTPDTVEYIEVTSGQLEINGELVTMGHTYEAQPKIELCIKAAADATYVCTYGDDPEGHLKKK